MDMKSLPDDELKNLAATPGPKVISMFFPPRNSGKLLKTVLSSKAIPKHGSDAAPGASFLSPSGSSGTTVWQRMSFRSVGSRSLQP